MKFLARIQNLLKRFFGFPKVLHTKPCTGNIKLGESVFFCTKKTGHFGPHRTYRGRHFF